MQFPRYPQMKIGRIGQDRELWLLFASRRKELPLFPINAGQMLHYLHQAHTAQLFGIHRRPHSQGEHPRLRTAEEIKISPPSSQCFDQAAGIEIATCLTR